MLMNIVGSLARSILNREFINRHDTIPSALPSDGIMTETNNSLEGLLKKKSEPEPSQQCNKTAGNNCMGHFSCNL